MKKIRILLLALFSILALTACDDETVTTFNGNEVVLVETGVYSYYVEVETQEQQDAILKALSELDYSEPEGEGGNSNNYGLKLTYDTGAGCELFLNYDESYITVQPFDAEGNTLYEESQSFIVPEEQMAELEVLFGIEPFTTFQGNEVVLVETGVYDNFVEVETQEQQEAILLELAELDYSEPEEEAINTNNYGLKLTYDTGAGCVIYFNYEDCYVTVQPFDAEGNALYEESQAFSVTEEQMSEFKVLFGIK